MEQLSGAAVEADGRESGFNGQLAPVTSHQLVERTPGDIGQLFVVTSDSMATVGQDHDVAQVIKGFFPLPLGIGNLAEEQPQLGVLTLQRFPAPGQFGLDLFAGADVLFNRQVAGDSADLVEQGRDRGVFPVERSVFTFIVELAAPLLAAGDGLPQQGVVFVGHLARFEHARILADRLFGAVAAGLAELGVNVFDRSARIGNHDRGRTLFDRPRHGAHLLIHSALLGQVNKGTYDPPQGTVRVGKGRLGDQYATLRSIGTGQDGFVVEQVLLLQNGAVHLTAFAGVFARQQVADRATLDLFQLVEAEKVQKRLVAADIGALGILVEHRVGDCVDDFLQKLVLAGQCLFGQLAFGDILQGFHRRHDLVGTVKNRRRFEKHIAPLATDSLKPPLGLEGAFGETGGDFLTVVQVDLVQPVVDHQIGQDRPFFFIKRCPLPLGPHHLERTHAGQFCYGVVPEQDRVVLVDHKHRGGGVLDDPAIKIPILDDRLLGRLHRLHHTVERLGQPLELVTGREADRLPLVLVHGDLIDMLGQHVDRPGQVAGHAPDQQY